VSLGREIVEPRAAARSPTPQSMPTLAILCSTKFDGFPLPASCAAELPQTIALNTSFHWHYAIKRLHVGSGMRTRIDPFSAIADPNANS
jgi:hypothetical protein